MTEWCRVAWARLSLRALGPFINVNELLPLELPQKTGDIVDVHFTTALLLWKKLLCSGNFRPILVVISPYMWIRRGYRMMAL